jgi:NAD(P) transhydrogenase
VHTGTLPSKTLRETALYITGFNRLNLYRGLAVNFTGEGRSVRDLMCRLPEVTTTQTEQIEQNIQRHGIDLIQGEAKLLDAHRVEISGNPTVSALETEFILIATGSSPRRPPAFDFTDADVFDSDTLLKLDRIPESLAVIGGGVIGSEYACVFATLGVKIQIIESGPRLLGFLDEEISEALMASMREQGIIIHVNSGVERLERVGKKLELRLKNGETMCVDKALVSAGRVGNSGNLGLENAGVALDPRGYISVDESFRTNVKNIFAAGDVMGKPSLASASMEQGRVAVAAMFDLDVPKRDWNVLPAGIYTIPEACSLGPTEQELKKNDVPYVIGRSHMRHNARGQIIGDVDGFVKLIFHRDTKKLLAVHLICERATELIHIGQAVIRMGGGIDYFLESVMTFPSLSVAYKYAAYDALGELRRGKNRPMPLQ